MSEDILIFGLGGRERYALAVSQIREIVKLGALNQVPGASEHMLGLARVRDQYIPVIDTKAILFRQPRGAQPDLAVVLDEREPIALAVLEVSQVMKATRPLDSQASSHGSFVEGIIQDEHGLIQKLSAADILAVFRCNATAPAGGVQHAA
ncbi:chemotaxis protein CheW [Pseudomonas sp. S1(2024)]|uniref:chemotaxis protein CheW n=1 Tax=Pseudomonas sp. S1(2024) TaxID=3390191 RepID=UPI00397D9A93